MAAIDMGRARACFSRFGCCQRIVSAAPVSLVLAFPVTGCSTGSAPAIIAFGAYFPDWLIFAIIAIAAAVGMRVGVGIAGHAAAIPFPLFTCLAVGILVAGASDLLWFGR